VRGILKYAPDDLDYTLFGATSDAQERPVGKMASVLLGGRAIQCLPLVWMSPTAARGRVPLVVRYMWTLNSALSRRRLQEFNILDFHRVEPVALFRGDARPKNLLLHQDMSVLRSASSDIMWRHAPWLYEAIEKRLFASLDRIYAVRQTAVQRYVRLYPGMADKFAFLPTWVDDSIFNSVESPDAANVLKQQLLGEIGVPKDRRLLIFVGRLDHQKDPLLLLQAFRSVATEIPDLHLVVIGDGNLRGRVEAEVATLELAGRVALLGVRGATEIARWLKVSDLFVLSSAYEGMPIAVLEALATGLPVVSTDVGEIRLLVKSNVNGEISPGRTAEHLAEAMIRALRNVEKLRGSSCVAAVQPYLPQRVLGLMYDNHRRQAGLRH
jgi:glycosyltransferase involved in cell wall biosynthesis